MLATSTCPACGSSRRFCWPALIAPFIADYVLRGEYPDCKLCDCVECGLRYFNLRYTSEEMTRLYDGYRGERYVSVRRQHEPGYTNIAAAGDAEIRRQGLERFLLRSLGEHFAGAVLDFGGDDGALIPDFFQGRRLVFDVTDKPLVDGVARIKDLKSLRDDPPGFVLLCHVLEHLSEPSSVLKPIADLLPRGGKLYVEVPDERFRLRWLGPPSFYRQWFEFAAQQHIAAPLVNATIRRLMRARVPPNAHDEGRPNRKTGFVEMLRSHLPPLEDLRLHEHINFFNPPSLALLVGRAGFRMITAASDSGVHRLLGERL